MTTTRFFAIAAIFALASIAWLTLSGTLQYRTASLGRSLQEKVNSLWGPSSPEQLAPLAVPPNADRGSSEASGPLSSQVLADFEHHNRYKGLLWFSTYSLTFSGTYKFAAGGPAGGEAGKAWKVFMSIPQECEQVRVQLDQQDVPKRYVPGEASTLSVDLPADGKEHVVAVAYEKARGRDRWSYRPAAAGQAGSLRDFSMTVKTNFEDIDYPDGSSSPSMPAQQIDGGKQATWKMDSDRTSKWMGIEMPRRADAGPIAARMSYFAPVSLLFFYTVLFTLVVLKKIPLHPMHYLFIAAGFFAFHILMAYLVDLINIHKAFWICAAVSVLLVVSYLRLVAGMKFAVLYAGAAQLVFLIGFSYAFFWTGYTGLAITIAAIVTLFVLMQATGRLNWNEVFHRRNNLPNVPPLPPLPQNASNRTAEHQSQE